jgi:hypothetical protein
MADDEQRKVVSSDLFKMLRRLRELEDERHTVAAQARAHLLVVISDMTDETFAMFMERVDPILRELLPDD